MELPAVAQATWFNGAGASVAALLLLRLTGLMWIAPVFSAKAIPVSIRTAATVVLVFLLWPMAAAQPTASAVQISAGTVLVELCLGMTMGLGSMVFVAAAQAAGDMLAVQMGLSGANVVDPTSQTQLPVLGNLLGLFATALILATGGHLVILRALHASFELVPLGQPVDLHQGTLAVVAMGGKLLTLGLQFAAPVVAAMMMGNATLGILARTVPQLNVLMVAFPVQISLGLFVLAASLPLIATAFDAWPESYGSLAGELLRSFSSGGVR